MAAAGQIDDWSFSFIRRDRSMKIHLSMERGLEPVACALGAILFFSPWVLGYFSHPVPAWNAWLVGATMIFVAAIAWFMEQKLSPFFLAVVGLWSIVAPWLIDFTAAAATIIHLVIGVALIGVGTVWELFKQGRSGPGIAT
jgi:hypothetical protein